MQTPFWDAGASVEKRRVFDECHVLKSVAIIAIAVASSLAAAHAVSVIDQRTKGMESRAAQPVAAVAQAAPAQPARGGAASLTKAADGHFWAEANVNGKRVRFLVDTGATTVALTAADAQRLGLDLADLTFDRPVMTAAGEAKAAMVELDYISVAGARVEKVQALVLREGLSASLLGMSYLGRLSRFEATPTALILRP
jgi:aspartyl protease family protein